MSIGSTPRGNDRTETTTSVLRAPPCSARSASHHRRPDRFLYGLVLYSNRAMAAQYNLCFYSIPRFLEKVHTFFHAPLFRTNFLSESLLRPCAPRVLQYSIYSYLFRLLLPMKQGGCLMSKKVNKLTEPNMRLYFLLAAVFCAVTLWIEPIFGLVEAGVMALTYVYFRRTAQKRRAGHPALRRGYDRRCGERGQVLHALGPLCHDGLPARYAGGAVSNESFLHSRA